MNKLDITAIYKLIELNDRTELTRTLRMKVVVSNEVFMSEQFDRVGGKNGGTVDLTDLNNQLKQQRITSVIQQRQISSDIPTTRQHGYNLSSLEI